MNLKKFTDMAADQKDGKKKLTDRYAGTTCKWRQLFKDIEGDPQPMTQALLEQTQIGQGYTAWDVAEDLDSFVSKHVFETIYYDRQHGWTSGEEGNGFALWKAMCLEHEGNHVLVQMGGRRLFNNWGGCTKTDDIEQHIRGWQENLYKHAADLVNCEEELFYQLLEILPEELEEEMAYDIFINNHKDIIEAIQKRYSYNKQRHQQRTVLNQHCAGRKTSMRPLAGGCSDGACQHGRSNTQSAQSSTPSFEEIVAMTMAALMKPKGSGKGADRGRSPGGSTKLK